MDEKATSEQGAAALAWISEHWTTSQDCPICTTRSWSVGGTAEIREFAGGALRVGGGGLMPIVPVVCNNCGYVLLFNAVVAGLVDAEKPEAPEGVAAEGTE